MAILKYLSAYPEHIKAQVEKLIENNELGLFLENRYPENHIITTDKMLYEYAIDIKNNFLKNTHPYQKPLMTAKSK